MIPVISADEAVKHFIKDEDTLAVGGFANGLMHPEKILISIEQSFSAKKFPKNLTLIYAAGQGDAKEKGLNHLGLEGLVAKVIGGHWGLVPKLQKLAADNKLAAYNLPQGVISHMFRDTAAGKPGVITHVGLETFVDPRLQGGKLNDKAYETGDLVELIQIDGEKKLFYKAIPIDVALIRATYADSKGNCTFEKEGVYADALVMAQAAKNSGGKVIVQVEKIAEHGSLDTRKIRLPGIYVDALVVSEPEYHMQSFGTFYNPALSGEIRVSLDNLQPLPMDGRKIIARRAAMELTEKAIVNLGIGIPEGVAAIAAEEKLKDIILTTEAGAIGGIPAYGLDFGASSNAECILDQPSQFDFYDGGGLDMAFLGLAQMDRHGNINVSKFGPKIAGCGGFINISQNSKKVVYCGTFTAGGLIVEISDGKLNILREGKVKKFISQVEQITFSSAYAISRNQSVLYVTERAVFELTPEGVELKEIAPGINLKKDVLDLMDFEPIIKDVKPMDSRIFSEVKMGLKIDRSDKNDNYRIENWR